MPPVPVATVARLVRGLSAVERREFLAAILTARGEDVVVDDGVLVVRGEETRRFEVVGRWPRGSTDADVLVGTHDTGRARAYAEEAGAAFVTPADLRDLLLYGIDRETADEIAREHLGRPLSASTGSGSIRQASGLAARGEPVQTAIVVAIGAAIVAVVLVSIVFSGTVPPGGGTGTGADAVEPATEVDVATTERVETYPPGLSAHGVTSAEDLVDVHVGLVAGESRIVHLLYEGPANASGFSTNERYELSIHLYTESNYLRSVERTTIVDGGNESNDVWTSEYRDGGTVHFRFERTNATGVIHEGVMQTEPADHGSDRLPTPSTLNNEFPRLYERAMSANVTDLETVAGPGDVRYRVNAAGTPAEDLDELGGLRATALLTGEGRLVSLSVSYVHPPTGEPVTFEVTYRDVGSVEPIEPPAWSVSVATGDDLTT